MVRAVVFDPVGREFVEQVRRYDWQLLRDSHVHRYDRADELGGACAALTGLGYRVHELDAERWRSMEDVYEAVAGALSFPAHFGRNLDALLDALRDVAEYEYGGDPASTGTALAIRNYDQVIEFDRRLAHGLLDVFALAARYGALLGHPMLCLVATASTDLGAVGATPVMPAPAPTPQR
jgi:hypothetical protein